MTGSGDLAGVRAAIDRLDADVVALLARREELVRAAGRLKTHGAAVRAPGRVEQVVARVRALAEEHGASPVVVERVHRAVIAAFVDLELATSGVPDGVAVGPAAPGSAGEVLTVQRAAYWPRRSCTATRGSCRSRRRSGRSPRPSPRAPC